MRKGNFSLDEGTMSVIRAWGHSNGRLSARGQVTDSVVRDFLRANGISTFDDTSEADEAYGEDDASNDTWISETSDDLQVERPSRKGFRVEVPEVVSRVVVDLDAGERREVVIPPGN